MHALRIPTHVTYVNFTHIPPEYWMKQQCFLWIFNLNIHPCIHTYIFQYFFVWKSQCSCRISTLKQKPIVKVVAAVVAQVSSLQKGTFVIFTLGESNFPWEFNGRKKGKARGEHDTQKQNNPFYYFPFF